MGKLEEALKWTPEEWWKHFGYDELKALANFYGEMIIITNIPNPESRWYDLNVISTQSGKELIRGTEPVPELAKKLVKSLTSNSSN